MFDYAMKKLFYALKIVRILRLLRFIRVSPIIVRLITGLPK